MSTGRVLNRFSKDVGFLDDALPYLFCEYAVVSERTSELHAFMLFLSFAVVYEVFSHSCHSSNPKSIPVDSIRSFATTVAGLQILLHHNCSRSQETWSSWWVELRNTLLLISLFCLPSSARSPIYSHLSTTLQGLPVIRSYSMQSATMDQFHSAQNHHTEAWYMYLLTTR